MDVAALPGRPREALRDRGLRAGVGVGDHEADPGKPPVPQRAQEPAPERLVLADVDPEDFTGALDADPGGRNDHPGDHLAERVVADIDVGRVEIDLREVHVTEGAIPEGSHPVVEGRADPGHLRLGDPGLHPKGRHQDADGARGDPVT